MYINIWQRFQICFPSDLFLTDYRHSQEVIFVSSCPSTTLILLFPILFFFFYLVTTQSFYIQLFLLNHSLLILHIYLQFINSQGLGVKDTVLSKTTNRFSKKTKCKTHHLPLCPTGYFHLSHLLCPPPSAPAVLSLPSVSLVHPTILPLAIMGAPYKRNLQ